ncbi:MAG: HAD family hydrolase [Clostridia bacterium]|nr:HAD family hydrolase [Clostridia bacterium]
MKQYDVILFDLDGTLTDPAEGITKSVEYALNQYGISVENREALLPFIGPPLIDSFMEFYEFSKEQAVEAVEVYREYFRVKGMFENEVYPYVPELLQALKNQGKTLLVASSKPEEFVKTILKHFGLLDYFDFVGGAAMDETRTKKEDVLRYVFAEANVTDLQKAIMVGDRKFDVEGAHAFGMDAIAVTYGYGSREELTAARPEYLADSPEEVETVLLSFPEKRK